MIDARSETDIEEEIPNDKTSVLNWAYCVAGIAITCILALSLLSGCSSQGKNTSDDDKRPAKVRKAGALTGTINGHDWVDLGLSSGVKWATCNVGADEAEEYGNYFGWGETQPKDDYSSINSQTYKVSKRKLKKAGIIDDSYTLTKEHDASNVQWGGTWRRPTDEEFGELIS